MRFSGSIPPRYIPLAVLTLLFFLQGPVLFGQGIAGEVVGVADGDTVTILDDRHIQRKIRKADVRCQRLEVSEGCALTREYF